MNRKIIARLEKLVDEIEDIAEKKVYPFHDDSDRLRDILNLIEDYKDETLI